MNTILTNYDKAEARIILKQCSDCVDVKVEGVNQVSKIVQDQVVRLMSIAISLSPQNDLFTGSNDPEYDAGILVRQCNDLLEVTPFYSRDLPNQPPFSKAELMAGKLITRFYEGHSHG